MSDKYLMYVSLWDHNPQATRGFALYTLDKKTGKLQFVKRFAEDIAFNQTGIDYEKNILYVCNESDFSQYCPYPNGTIYAYKVNPENGELFEYFHQLTGCPCPDYLSLTPDKKFMVVSHHSTPDISITKMKKIDGKWVGVPDICDSTVQLWEMTDDGKMGELCDVKFHVKEGPIKIWNTGRIQNCHPHACRVSPSGNVVCVPDKGDGHIYMYKINRETKELELRTRILALNENCQVRYPFYHPTKPWVYICEEAAFGDDLRIFAYEYSEEGDLKPIGAYSILGDVTLDPPFISSIQGFCMDSKGTYLYASGRNPEIVAVMKIDQTTGELELIQHIDIPGRPRGSRMPRGLAITPDDKFVVASCLNTPMIAVFAVGEDGKLTQVDYDTHTAGGSFVTFYEPEN